MFESPTSFKGADNPAITGDISLDYLYLTEALLDEPKLELQVVCTLVDDSPLKKTNASRGLQALSRTKRSTLNIILYGPPDLAEPIFNFIQECNDNLEDEAKIYLQDPVGCDRNVPYYNPQRLPPLDPFRQEFTLHLSRKIPLPINTGELQPLPELLELLDSQEDLPEATQPPKISTTLKRYVGFPVLHVLYEASSLRLTDYNVFEDIRSKL